MLPGAGGKQRRRGLLRIRDESHHWWLAILEKAMLFNSSYISVSSAHICGMQANDAQQPHNTGATRGWMLTFPSF